MQLASAIAVLQGGESLLSILKVITWRNATLIRIYMRAL